jgi:hypothetical protein
MRWNAHPPGFVVVSVAVSAIFGLAPLLGHSQPASPQPDGTAPKVRAMATLRADTPSAPAIQMRPNLPPPPAVIPISGGVMSPLEAGTAPVLGEPYSGIQTTTILNGGKLLMRLTTRFFRDSHGRTRVEEMLPTDASTETSPIITSVTINDPVSGQEYTLQPQGKTAVVSPLPSSLAAGMQPPVTPPIPTGVPPWGLPGVQEAKPTPLGQKFIDGIAVVGTRVEDTITFPDREPETIIIDQWFSPELGVALQRTHQASGVDSTQRLEHIVRAEPDPALFVVPREYTRSEAPSHPGPH